jgi:hypothetical protein
MSAVLAAICATLRWAVIPAIPATHDAAHTLSVDTTKLATFAATLQSALSQCKTVSRHRIKMSWKWSKIGFVICFRPELSVLMQCCLFLAILVFSCINRILSMWNTVNSVHFHTIAMIWILIITTSQFLSKLNQDQWFKFINIHSVKSFANRDHYSMCTTSVF